MVVVVVLMVVLMVVVVEVVLMVVGFVTFPRINFLWNLQAKHHVELSNRISKFLVKTKKTSWKTKYIEKINHILHHAH